MIVKDLIDLVKHYTQDNQSKLPKNIADWNIYIKESIKDILDDDSVASISKHLLVDTKEGNTVYKEIGTLIFREPNNLSSNDEEIDIDKDLARAVVFDLSANFSKEPVMKQLMLKNKEEVIDNFLWNKYKESFNESIS